MDTTTYANVDMRTAFDATPAALRRSALTWQRSHASTPVVTRGGVRLDAVAARLRGAVDAHLVRGGERTTAGSTPRTTVPSSGTTPTSPPV
ncbi:hypothetical protein [Kineococcus indalonis]|uniref:hypothetical protein n=1 Tax=Kineococcus indalonis TaxID=2696566 RepID=UPI0014126762|nr:hypothetical protein [Kineococcus indalonis]NAZ87633.1 hypothetical protein [Kineococcus indalonis]